MTAFILSSRWYTSVSQTTRPPLDRHSSWYSGKALAAEVLTVQRDSVVSGRYPALLPLLKEISVLRTRIARLRLDGPREMRPEVFQAFQTRWQAQLERLEGDLSSQVPELELAQSLRCIEASLLAERLTPEPISSNTFASLPTTSRALRRTRSPHRGLRDTLHSYCDRVGRTAWNLLIWARPGRSIR